MIATASASRSTLAPPASKPRPAWSYSALMCPAPRPSSSRPSVRRSTAAASRASRTGWRESLLSTAVPIRRVFVTAAALTNAGIGALISAESSGTLGERRALVEELPAPDHAADEVDAVGLLRVEPPPREQEVERDAEPHDVGQPLGQARLGPDVPAAVHHAELRVVGGDADVARHRELHAAREAVTVDRGDDRFPDVDTLRDAAEVRPLVRAPAVPLRRPLRDGLHVGPQIRARAEGLRPGAGEDRHVELRVVAEVVPDLPQVAVHRLLEAVLVLRVVERDVRDVPLLLVADLAQFECHAGALLFKSWRWVAGLYHGHAAPRPAEPRAGGGAARGPRRRAAPERARPRRRRGA